MKILRNIISIITILIFTFSILIIINASFSIRNNKVPNIFGYSYMNVTTGSMEPVLKVNDIIVVKKASTYKIDDIISFYYDVNNDGIKEVVTHQIIAYDDIITTHGVNNPISQIEEINKEAVIGKVVYKSTFLGTILSNEIVTNKIYILSFIIVCLLIYIVYLIIKMIKIVKKKDSE